MQTNREVASGVVNLGNTCYMNAVLQALAHAPELCMAIDLEPHSASCQISKNNDDKFCILCELENHLLRVHKPRQGNGSLTSDAVTPTDFVNGFVKYIAPGFKLGVQEDSHEFLRLLIDAMQSSCNNENHNTLHEDPNKLNSTKSRFGNEYSYRLFCGKVESTVQCSHCNAVSSKIDPIEDIGLEVIPTSKGSSGLADITTALDKFVATEKLDSGYKCESCGKIGQATKATRLSSIPPLLTLHLKRFRYGNEALTGGSSSRRRASDISSLGVGGGDVGSSGSSKIEGHVKFIEVFDIKPYLTEEQKKVTKAMLCRLFAVVVHTGKNSHSGHYICYVRNFVKNEWWKMDDARVTRASKEDVMSAEAYMLFYNVVNHPISDELKKNHKAMLLNIESKRDASIEIIDTISKKEELKLSGSKRKREAPEFSSGEDFIQKMIAEPNSIMKSIQVVQEYFTKLIQLKPEYLQSMKEEIESGVVSGSGPSIGISSDDIENKDAIQSSIFRVLKAILPKDSFLLNGHITKHDKTSVDHKSHNLIIPVQNQNDNLI